LAPVAVVAVVAAAFASAAFAAQGHGRFGGRFALRAPALSRAGGGLFGTNAFGFRAGGPGFFGGQGGFGLGGFGMGGPGIGAGGGTALLGADVLNPAASFLGISVTKLESDLNGGKTLAQEASDNGKKASDLITAIVSSLKTNLDNAQAAGWITADQETALVMQLTNEVTLLVNNGPGIPRVAGNGGGGYLQTAATYLGISVSDLQSDLQGGKSLADVVSSVGNGKTVDGLVTALEAPAKSNLDAAVTAKKITQAQETAILSRMTTALTNLVNGTKPTSSQTSSTMRTVQLYATKVFTRKH
jgi:hypothetical protein